MKKFMISALLLTVIGCSAFWGTSSHVVKAAAISNRGGFKVTVAHGKGTTASVNGKSVPGYSEAWTRADVRPDGQGWSYATDAGQGVKYHR